MTSSIELAQYSGNQPHEKSSIVDSEHEAFSTHFESTSNQKTHSLVIPAYNEENRIRPFLEDISVNIPRDWEIIIVCDGKDKTAEIAKSFGGRFSVLEFKHKLGKVFSHVDDSNPVAIASRWVRGSNMIEKQPFLRLLLGRIYHYATFAILGIRQKDTQCGLKVYHKDTIQEVMKRLKITNLSIDTAILYHCKLLNYNVTEVPVTWRDIVGSKFSPFKTALVMFATLLGLRLTHSSRAKKIKQLLSVLHEMANDI